MNADKKYHSIGNFTSAMIACFALIGMAYGQATWEKTVLAPKENHTRQFASITFGNDRFVAVGSAGEIITSTDGKVWAEQTSGTTEPLDVAVFGNGRFLVTSRAGTLTSTDGVVWTPSTTVLPTIITFYNNQFVAVANDSVLTSPDGIAWAKTASSVRTTMVAIGCSESKCVILGWRDTVLTSPDGTTWTMGSTDTSRSFFSVAYGNGIFVAVGERGTVMTSEDGGSWAIRNAGNNRGLGPVIYANNQFVTLSSNTYIYVSTDGITWALKRQGGNDLSMQALAFGNNTFVAVGMGDTILTSQAEVTAISHSGIRGERDKTIKTTFSNGTICATLPVSDNACQLSVQLVTVTGRLVYSASVNSRTGKLRVPAAGFPAGAYILSVMTATGKTTTSSFVLSR